ncbi:MAG: hypothetical protein J5I41_10285, partial [Saprospiraceae bacterium]|nr:hypothetical protein [Saprospiraceae bacterium]
MIPVYSFAVTCPLPGQDYASRIQGNYFKKKNSSTCRLDSSPKLSEKGKLINFDIDRNAPFHNKQIRIVPDRGDVTRGRAPWDNREEGSFTYPAINHFSTNINLDMPCPDTVQYPCLSNIPPPYATLQDFEQEVGPIGTSCLMGVDPSSWSFSQTVTDTSACPVTIVRTYRVQDFCGNRDSCIHILRVPFWGSLTPPSPGASTVL